MTTVAEPGDQVAGVTMTTGSEAQIELVERFSAHNYHPLPVVVAEAEGAWVTDVEGRRYLDMLAAYSALNFGHRHPDLVRAAHEGFDVLLTGEPEEPNLHAAQELGIHLIAAGHHATERYGVQALAAALADRFDLTWSYLEIPNPV